MKQELVSKDTLLEQGWTARQIEAALDEPDEVGPSGHWYNSNGKPYYLRDRVEVAAFRIGLSDKRPSPSQWKRWEADARPTCLPLLTLDFHGLAEKCMPGVTRELWSLRLSHRVAGRWPGSEDKEETLIKKLLPMLAQYAYDVDLANRKSFERFLQERSRLSPEHLGPMWPANVTVRPARRASYVSKGTGRASKRKAIDALALVHCGQVLGPKGERLELVDALVRSPRLRFDRWSLAP